LLDRHDSLLPASQYPIDAENMAEMARLAKQASIITTHLGLLPSQINPAHMQAALDIACGPGEWALSLAEQYPHLTVTGIDLSRRMIDYAHYQAQERQRHRVHFQVMDARAPLAFPDASFDLIHARLITTFLPTGMWPALVSECVRLLRPGGFFCTTEDENIGISTSPSLMRYSTLCADALRKAGMCFTSEGASFGITAVQARLLAQAGFAHVEQQAAVINYSAGTVAHPLLTQDWEVALRLVQPFLVQSGVATQNELDILYARLCEEMHTDQFSAVIYFQTAWGQKVV